MSATIDANLLLYASDTASRYHEQALETVTRLGQGPDLLYVFWPVVMAYLRIATHPRIFKQPLDPDTARANIARLLDASHVRAPGEGEGFWAFYEATVAEDVIRGNLVPDAHLVALMRQNGVRKIYTADRDFHRFQGIEAANPFRT